MFTYENVDELFKAMDELKSMEGNELDLIKRGLDQLQLILDVKEKQLGDCFKEIENYKKTISLLNRLLKRSEDHVKQLLNEKNQIERQQTSDYKDFFSFIQ
jgi:CII-binding regulator of phage lambda lysogenization HflD